MITTLKEIVEVAKSRNKMRLVVAAAQDPDALAALQAAREIGLVEGILVGDLEKIQAYAQTIGMDLADYRVVNKADLEEAAAEAVRLVGAGEVDFIMKGLIDTSLLLKAVLHKEAGLRTEQLLSHVMVYEAAAYHKLLLLTDGGMNIEPTLEEKQGILANSVVVARALGNQDIKVACIAAKEKVSPKMKSTVEGAALKELAETGFFGTDVTVAGPIAFDLAVSKEAARIKGYQSPVAGEADILLVPTIEVGNGMGKTLTYLAQAQSAGIIMGAKVPIVLVSRADSAETKLYSIALGSLIAGIPGA